MTDAEQIDRLAHEIVAVVRAETEWFDFEFRDGSFSRRDSQRIARRLAARGVRVMPVTPILETPLLDDVAARRGGAV